MSKPKDGSGLGVLGIDHRHIWGMLSGMEAQGARALGWWSEGTPPMGEMFASDFPHVPARPREDILNDPAIDMILISAVPADRADLAIAAMEAGKDVMVDKPGCTTLEQLAQIREVQARTGRIWSVNFSERFEVPAVTRASELVAGGEIGRVRQVLGLGPHRQNLSSRPSWFFERDRYGGILCDIGSHQVDQFLHFTGADDVQVAHALAENRSAPDHPGFQDFGELVLNADGAHGYIRVDWFTPDALPTWGDGRLFLLGERGTIELRKYVDVARGAGNMLYLATHDRVEAMDCSDAGLPYFPRLIADIEARTETACGQDHTFRAMEIALRAQEMAEE